MKRLIPMLLLLVSGVSSVSAAGFYVDGFRQGMKLNEAMNVAKSRGAILKKSNIHYEVEFGPRLYSLSFCGPNSRVWGLK